MLENGCSHDVVACSLSDAFRMEASSTLQKRVSPLNRLSKLLCNAGHLYPLRVTEEQLYEALCSMRSSHAGPTSAQHVLEALHFLDATISLTLTNIATVISGRCRGVSRDMFLKKDPLKQKHPLSVSQVSPLEHTMETLPMALRCICGQLLFCIHAACRWKDSQRIKQLMVESSQGETLVHADAIGSKTALTAESKTRFLPYVALGTGVLGKDWSALWVEARDYEGLTFGNHALPSFSEGTSSWAN